VIRQVSESFGYQEYEGPYLERLELYAAKSGEELVKEQAFVFPDRSGEMLALRPELTPTLARMVAARAKSTPMPIRWWAFGPFWRYERPQRGRSREFLQWNIDLLGVDSPEADAELLAVTAFFFQAVGLSPAQVQILLNDRRLAEHRLTSLGIAKEKLTPIYQLIDRLEKRDRDAWRAEALQLGLSQEQLGELEAMLADKEAWRESDTLRRVLAACEAMGIQEYVTYDPTVIRGLDYYTGTVFEARVVGRKERAILGGGRYDNLVAEVGGDPIPGVGFAMGDVVLLLVLESFNLLPALPMRPAPILLTTFNHETTLETLRLASDLRRAAIPVEWYPKPDRLPKQFRFANRQGFFWVLVLGPDELASGSVLVKDLRTGEQQAVARGDLIAHLKGLLEQLSSP
jgi:histidyl-tRNA synthetase